MTARRQEKKARYLRIASVAVMGGVLGGAILAVNPQQGWALTERVVINRLTGLAIDGFDPVAYFTDGKAIKGDDDIEASQDGTIWRFHNESNRGFFLAHPEIYGPQFGGYDPVDVARGKIIAGRPQLWVISGERLYLFSREDNQSVFAADPAGILKRAATSWPELVKTLPNY